MQVDFPQLYAMMEQLDVTTYIHLDDNNNHLPGDKTMSRIDAELIAADEGFNHQIAETFASVQQADRSWTEKVWASVCSKNGDISIGFGIGKYINRNVMDAAAGISRGTQQWTVRSSRQLMPTPDTTSVGPIHYQVVESFKKIRFRLDANEHQPISFDVTFDGTLLPPFLENHEFRRQFGGYRTDNDLVRYHQAGTATGWIQVEDERYEVTPEDFFAVRDHSWGLRYGVGETPVDIMPGIDVTQLPMNFLWSPMRFQLPDGGQYGIHHFYMALNIPGLDSTFFGAIEHPDGSKELIKALTPDLQYDDKTRRLKGGKLQFTLADGSAKTVLVEVVGNTGFHLGAALYFGLDGKHHGQWRGPLHTEGEFYDCADQATLKRLHQIRDCIIKVTDLQTGAQGYAMYQTVITGQWDALGLTTANSFL